MTDLELQIQAICTNLGQVGYVKAYLTSIDRPKIAAPLTDTEKHLRAYRDLLISQLKTQDATDPTWHDT